MRTNDQPLSRRDLLRLLGVGLGATVLGGAVAGRASALPNSLLNNPLNNPGPATSAPTWGVVGGTNPGQTPITPTTRVPVPPPPDFARIIEQVVNMPFDDDLVSRARRYGLDVLNVTWEDTGRDQGSSVGPNISDLTLQVREPVDGGERTHLLPVLRFPNFNDTTADVRIDKLWVRVGNQDKRTSMVTVPLAELLSNMRAYLSDPYSLPSSGNFLRKRDTHALVSAQHVFMPLPATGKAEFTPVLYNYQSSQGNPAVLTLLITREGTSATIIENYSGDQSYQSWGQQLFFNNKGQRTTFTAERRSAVKGRVDSGKSTAGDAGALDSGADMVLIVQIPLIHRTDVYPSSPSGVGGSAEGVAAAPSAGASAQKEAPVERRRSDVEAAVIGHGEDGGPFTEMQGKSLERDEQFPIRVTVQFYRATSNGVVSDADLNDVKMQIDSVYRNGDAIGSLVVPANDRPRPTAWKKGRTPYKA